MNQILSEYSTWDETALSAVLKTCNMASLLGSRDKARCHSFHAILPILHVSIQSFTSLNANIPMPFLNILYTMLDSFQSLAQHLEVLEIDLLLPSKPLNDLLCIWIL